MPNITNDTNLGTLALLRMQYGVLKMTTEYGDNGECVVTLITSEHHVQGRSTAKNAKLVPEAEALDDAFARLKHMLGATLTAEGAANGLSAKWSL